MAEPAATAARAAPTGEAEDRPRRADALRNRRRILEAAEAVFADQGVNVAIDVVAERAGVGVGTLYRHFPTKEALFEAVVVSRIEALNDLCTEHERQEPVAAYFSFLTTVAEHATAKHDLMEALGAAEVDFKARCAAQMAQLEAGIERLQQRAVAAGGIRADVTSREVLGLVIGACMAAEHLGHEPVGRPSLLGVVFDGLRPRN